MPTRNSSIGDADDQAGLNIPGRRTGEGAESVLPYLHDSLASRPGELFPSDQASRRNPVKSLASRIRRAIQGVRKSGHDEN